MDALATSTDGRPLVTGGRNDVENGGQPALDGYGRPATFTECIVLCGRHPDFVATRDIWDRVRAASIDAFAIASDDRSGSCIMEAHALQV